MSWRGILNSLQEFFIPDTFGVWVKDIILWFANILTNDAVPGFVAGLLLVGMFIIVALLITKTMRQTSAIKKLRDMVNQSKTEREFAKQYSTICAKVESWPKSSKLFRLSKTWAEFRETVVEPSEDQNGVIQNSARPDEFFNTYNLGFGLNSWRFWPGVFVSVGLFLTFLGLVAALVQTGSVLEEAGAGADQATMTNALSNLLSVASAKFIMSLSGLFASIVISLAIRVCASLIENTVSSLAHEIEGRVQFLSLADIAQKQLSETVELRAHLTKLNSELIAALSKPLENAANQGGNAAAEIMKTVGEQLSSGLTQTIADAGTAMENAATSMRETTVGLDAVSRRVEATIQALAQAAEHLEKGATPLASSITGTADSARVISNASVEFVETASATLKQQTLALTGAADAIREQINAFEARARTYDGDMENALKVYKENLDAAMSDVQAFSGDVHKQYADALQRLRSVIEGARAFSPDQNMRSEAEAESGPDDSTQPPSATT